MIECPTLNCKRARLHIALAVGGDLDEPGEAAMNAHLAECPPCQRLLNSMKSNLKPLQEREEDTPYTLHDSLWPDLSERLPARNGFSLLHYNGWWTACAVLVACVAIAMFWQKESEILRDFDRKAVVVPDVDSGDTRDSSSPWAISVDLPGLKKQQQPAEKPVRPPSPFFQLPDSKLVLPVIPQEGGDSASFQLIK